MGRVTSNVQQHEPQSPITLNFTYDLLGNLKTLSNLAEGVTYTNSYDTAARLTQFQSSLVDANHPGTLLTVNQYNALGEPQQATLGNGIVGNQVYDSRGRLTSQTDGSVYSFTLGLAPDNNVVTGNDSINGNWTYTYDDFSRLATSAKTGQAFNYKYDRFSNRWQQNVTTGSGPAPQYTLDANNHLVSFSYDAAGNLLNDAFHSYTYDAEGRVITVDGGSTASYVYDALGRRAQPKVGANTVDFIYDQAGRVITQMNPAWHWSELYASGLHVVTYAAGATYFDHNDWLGTVRARSDVTGASSETCSSLLFGDAQNCTGTDRATLHFTGKEGDTESNLTHFWFRQLSTTQGRWIMPDPVGMTAVNPADPQSWNRYTYVGNNPASAIDPLGLWDDGGGDAPECRPGDPFCDPCVFTVDCGDPGIPPAGPIPLPPPHKGPFGGGGGSRIGEKWPNGETLGLPTGLNLKPMSLADLIGMSPGTSCDFGVCPPVGSPFSAGTIAIGAGETIGKVVLTAADALGILLGVLLMQTGDGSPCAKNPEAIGCGKWQCTASCNVQGIGNVNPTIDRVLGTGFGSTEVEACTNAKRAATQYAPTGTYARHCRCSCTKR